MAAPPDAIIIRKRLVASAFWPEHQCRCRDPQEENESFDYKPDDGVCRATAGEGVGAMSNPNCVDDDGEGED